MRKIQVLNISILFIAALLCPPSPLSSAESPLLHPSSLPAGAGVPLLDRSWRHNLPSEADFLLPRRNRELSILYHGAQERLRLKVHDPITGAKRCMGRFTSLHGERG